MTRPRRFPVLASLLLLPWAALSGVAPTWIKTARADAPLPPPATVRAASPGGTCVATATPRPAGIAVRAAVEPDRVRWSLPFWNPNLVLSDDCRVLGAGYDRGPLLVPAEKEPGTVVMTFYRDGRMTREVRLGELYPDLSVLPRTASHWLWRREEAWSGRAWTVRTVDGRSLSFAP